MEKNWLNYIFLVLKFQKNYLDRTLFSFTYETEKKLIMGISYKKNEKTVF